MYLTLHFVDSNESSSDSQRSTTSSTSNDDSNTTIIICIVLAIGMTLFGLVVAIGIFYRKKIRSAMKEDPEGKSMMSTSKFRSGLVPISGILEGKFDMPDEDEFKRLFEYEDKIESKLSTYQGKRYNDRMDSNLKDRILPYDHNRIKLKNLVDGSDYINASLISPLRRSEEPSYDEVIYSSYVPTFQIQFIVSQEPRETTLTRHFQMIHEQKVHVVISLHRGRGTKMLLVGKVDSFNHMTRKTVKRIQVSDTMCVYIYELFNTTSVETQHKTQVLSFEIYDFPKKDDFDAEDARNLLTNIASIRKQIKAKNNVLKMMVYDDEAGLCGASIFVALYEIMANVDSSVNEHNQLKTSAEDVNVFEVVNGLRKDRMNMINTFGAYKFLHLCLMEYGPNRKTYDAIKSKKLHTTDLQKERKLAVNKTSADEDDLDGYSFDGIEYLLPIQGQGPQNEVEEEYVLHNPENEEHHEYLDAYKVYDNEGGVYVNDNMYLE